MKAVCTNCGKGYIFDAGAIPAEGYNAKCTDCGQVFLVSPGSESQAGIDDELDFEAMMAAKKKTRRIAFALVGGLATIMLGLYFIHPPTFDLLIGQWVGIKAGIDPAAVPHFEAGYVKFCSDSEAAYGDASSDFAMALRIDPLYPDAIVFGCLSQVFLSLKIRAHGRIVYDQGSEVVKQINDLDARNKKRRVRGYNKIRDELRARGDMLNEQSRTFFSMAGRKKNAGFQILRAQQKHLQTNPVWLQGYGIYHTLDSDHIPKARKALRNILILDGRDPDQPLDINDPPSLWTVVLNGLIHAGRDQPNKASRSIAAASLEAALAIVEQAKGPDLVRVRVIVARLHHEQGDDAKAMAYAKQVLDKHPAHTEAKALLKAIGKQSAKSP